MFDNIVHIESKFAIENCKRVLDQLVLSLSYIVGLVFVFFVNFFYQYKVLQ